MTDDGQHIEPFIPLRLLHLSEEKKSPQKKNKTLLLGAWHTRSLHSLNGAPDRRPSKSAVESKRVVKEKSGSKVSEKGKVEEEEEGTRLFFGGIWQLSSSVVFFFFLIDRRRRHQPKGFFSLYCRPLLFRTQLFRSADSAALSIFWICLLSPGGRKEREGRQLLTPKEPKWFGPLLSFFDGALLTAATRKRRRVNSSGGIEGKARTWRGLFMARLFNGRSSTFCIIDIVLFFHITPFIPLAFIWLWWSISSSLFFFYFFFFSLWNKPGL